MIAPGGAGHDHDRVYARPDRRLDSALHHRRVDGRPGVGLRVSLGLALIALIMVLAENARIPVDNPATHLELTMVHEAMVLEYSGAISRSSSFPRSSSFCSMYR
jgi:hypothetical protein